MTAYDEFMVQLVGAANKVLPKSKAMKHRKRRFPDSSISNAVKRRNKMGKEWRAALM